MCEQGTIGFRITSDWLRKWCRLIQSESEVKQNQSKHNITFDTHLKTTLYTGTAETILKWYWAKKSGQDFVKCICKIRHVLLLSSRKIRTLSLTSGAMKNQPKQKSGRAIPATPPPQSLIFDNYSTRACWISNDR